MLEINFTIGQKGTDTLIFSQRQICKMCYIYTNHSFTQYTPTKMLVHLKHHFVSGLDATLFVKLPVCAVGEINSRKFVEPKARLNPARSGKHLFLRFFFQHPAVHLRASKLLLLPVCDYEWLWTETADRSFLMISLTEIKNKRKVSIFVFALFWVYLIFF